MASDPVAVGVVIGRLRRYRININAIDVGRMQFRRQDAQDAGSAAHVHHDMAPDPVLDLHHGLHHHVGRLVVAGAEGHLRIDLDREPRLAQRLAHGGICQDEVLTGVVPGLDGHVPPDDDGLELVLPLAVPVLVRDQVGAERSFVGDPGEDDFQSAGVVGVLRDIGLQSVFFDDEGVIGKVAEFGFDDFGRFFGEGLDTEGYFNVFGTVHSLIVLHPAGGLPAPGRALRDTVCRRRRGCVGSR